MKKCPHCKKLLASKPYRKSLTLEKVRELIKNPGTNTFSSKADRIRAELHLEALEKIHKIKSSEK